MTNEEAIERINEHIAIHRYNEPHAIRIAEALQMAIEALEKQIPKKPMISIDASNPNLWHLYCPTCGSWVGINRRLKGTNMYNNTNSEICAKCGQIFELNFEEREI